MPDLEKNLLLDRCPHCSVAKPNLREQHRMETQDHAGELLRRWCIHACNTCGGVVTAWSMQFGQQVLGYYPGLKEIDEFVPERPRAYLQQAVESLHAPAGAVMLAASAVDAMLKLRGLAEGSLYTRVEQAAEQNLITEDMTKWAHEVRLDANDQRHADVGATLPSHEDGQRAVDFATALAEILFVLPGRVTRGIDEAAG